MVLFVLHKLILQMRMWSHPMGLDVWFLVGPFIYFHTSYVRTAKALARLRICAGSPEPSLVTYVISTIISWAGSNLFGKVLIKFILTAHFCRSASSLTLFFFFISLHDPPRNVLCLYILIKHWSLTEQQYMYLGYSNAFDWMDLKKEVLDKNLPISCIY